MLGNASFISFILCEGEEKSINFSSSITRMVSHGRLVTPMSSGGNTFQGAVDSEEEGTELADEDDIIFGYGNMDSSAAYIKVCAYLILALQPILFTHF